MRLRLPDRSLHRHGIGAAGLAQDEAKVKAGLDVWKTAGCSECHGAFADGERQRDEAPDRRQSAADAARRRRDRRDDPVRARRHRHAEIRRGRLHTSAAATGSRPAPVPDDLYPAPRARLSTRARSTPSSCLSACARRRSARGHAGGMRAIYYGEEAGIVSATIQNADKMTFRACPPQRMNACCPASSRR